MLMTSCSAQVSRLNLPQFLPPPESSLDSVSYRGDAKSRVKPLDLSGIHQKHSTAAQGIAATDVAAGAASAPSATSSFFLPAIASSNLPPSISALSLGASASQRQVLGSQPRNRHGGLHAAASQSELSALTTSPVQSSRRAQLPAQTSSSNAAKGAWQSSTATEAARTAHGSDSHVLAGGSWQDIDAAASAHEQWVLRRQAARRSQEEEQWGQLTVQLPDQAGSVSQQLLQQVPDELQETAQFCAVSKVRWQTMLSKMHCASASWSHSLQHSHALHTCMPCHVMRLHCCWLHISCYVSQGGLPKRQPLISCMLQTCHDSPCASSLMYGLSREVCFSVQHIVTVISLLYVRVSCHPSLWYLLWYLYVSPLFNEFHIIPRYRYQLLVFLP